MNTYNPPVLGATTIISELEIRNNPDLPVADSTKIRGGAHRALTLIERNAIPATLRKEGVTRVYVQEDDTFYFLKGGIDNSNWVSEKREELFDPNLLESGKYYAVSKNVNGELVFSNLENLGIDFGEVQPLGFVVERKTDSIIDLNTEGILPGIYRAVAGTSVFPVGANASGPEGAWGEGTLVTIHGETTPLTITQIYYPATEAGAAGTHLKNTYTRTKKMNTPDAATMAATPWRMIPYSDNIKSAVVQSANFQVGPGESFSLAFPLSSIVAANPPFTVTQLTFHSWLKTTLNPTEIQINGTAPSSAQTDPSTVLFKVRDDLGVETVFALYVEVVEPEQVFDGSANIDVVFPDTADFDMRLQCVTPGTDISNLSFKPTSDNNRYLRPVGFNSTDPETLYGVASAGKANTGQASLKMYRFGINLGLIRQNFGSLSSIKFDIYAGRKSGYVDDLFFFTLNRAIGGTLEADAIPSGPVDWHSTGTDPNPGGTRYPASPNNSNMYKAWASAPAERKVATLEYFFDSNQYTLSYIPQIAMAASLWNEETGAIKVTDLTNNQQIDFPSQIDFWLTVSGIHDRVQGFVTRPDGSSGNFDIVLTNGSISNGDMYEFNPDGSEIRQYGTYQLAFKAFYLGIERAVLNLSVVSKAPIVPTVYTIIPKLRDESVEPNVVIDLENGQEYDLPDLFDVGWEVTGEHDQVQAVRTRPNGEIFPWGPENVNNGNPVSSGNYQMNGPGGSESRMYGTYTYAIGLLKGGVERARLTTTFVSRQPIIIPPDEGTYTLQSLQKGYVSLMDISISGESENWRITDNCTAAPPNGHHWWYWVGSKVVRTNTRLENEPWMGNQPGQVTKLAIRSEITNPDQLDLGVTVADFQQVGALFDKGDVGATACFFFDS